MGAWVKIEGTFKQLIQSKEPFEDIEVKEDYSWQDGDNLIRLDEAVIFGDSGAFHCKPKDGYMLIMRVATENSEFFVDQISETYRYDGDDDESDPPSDVDWVREIYVYEDTESTTLGSSFIGENQSNAVFTLYGDTSPRDYISVDVDGDHSGIANFKIRKNGTQMVISKETSDDTFVRLMGAYKWMPDATPTTTETSEDTGEGSDTATIPLNVDENIVVDNTGEESDTGEDKPPIVNPEPDPNPTPEPSPSPTPNPNPEPEDDDDELSSTSIVLLIVAIGALIGTAIVVARMGSGE